MSEEKWYTYPEDEQDSGRSQRMVVNSIILGLAVALILGVAVFMLFSGRVANMGLNGGSIWIIVATLPFLLLLGIFLVMLRARDATPVFPQGDSRTVMFIIAVGVVILGLAVMLYMFMR